MAILVTGASGFVGVNVVERLLDDGEQVLAVDRNRFPIDASESAVRHGKNFTPVHADVVDFAQVDALFREFQIDRVVHAAAITADAAREAGQADRIVGVNVLGTINVLSAARAARCRRVVYVGSGQAYGRTHDEGDVLLEDQSPSRPSDIYGITKFAGEQIALRLRELWRFDVVCIRLGSVCGPWEADTGVRDMLSPYFQVTRCAIDGGDAVLPRHEPRRDWIYSRDAAGGIARALVADAPAHQLYHLTSGMDWKDRFTQWCEALRSRYPRFSWRLADSCHPPNISFIVERDRSPMSIDRIVNDLHFKPRFDPDNAFVDYLAWIAGHEMLFRSGDRPSAG